ncbi:hypothetical protein ACFBZI_11325 [Moraxella sp. ZJ142]|uniref:hypothetical protein n=1 Tax=Moraxella marmotae TaxID=3344520 RepID=UPI0035D4E5BC
MKKGLIFTSAIAVSVLSGDVLAAPKAVANEAYAIEELGDNFSRDSIKKSGSFLVDRCYNVEEYAIKLGAYKPSSRDINYCDYKRSGKILEKAFKEPTNFNKNYVLHQEAYTDAKGKTLYSLIAVNKTNKKVAVLPLSTKISKPTNRNTGLVFNKNSNKFCVSNKGKFIVWDNLGNFPYDGDAINGSCFWLKEDRQGPYWSLQQ